MNAADFDYELPEWNVPPPRPNQVSTEAWLEWLEENRRELIRSGRMQAIRDDPLRCPVNAPFKL